MLESSHQEVQLNNKRENEDREWTALALAPPAAHNNNSNKYNRWRTEETLALLRVRHAYDFAFRNAATRNQSPLWHEVARKMAELGYNRTASKCKQKFENIYNYHTRLKSCRNAQSSGKKYHSSDQLKVPDCHEVSFEATDHQQPPIASKDSPVAVNLQTGKPPSIPQLAVPISIHFDSFPATTTASMSTESPSESESEGARKINWEDYFWGLMNSFLEKQEDLQKKFLEAVDRWEHECEAWKVREMVRTKREHDLASGDVVEALGQNSRIMSPMTKTTGTAMATTQSTPTLSLLPTTLTAPVSTLTSAASPTRASRTSPMQAESIICRTEEVTGKNICPRPPRWSKQEAEALIRVKSEMNIENKELPALSWDDVSMRMRSIGYDRSVKMCKEKWKSMKRSCKKMIDNNKVLPLNSIRCPYYHHLDELNMDKKLDNNSFDCNLKPEEFLMHCVNPQPELQQPRKRVMVQQVQDLNENGNSRHGED